MVLYRPLQIIALALFVVSGTAGASSASEAHLEKSAAFIRGLADRAIETLTQADIGKEERRDKFRTLFRESFAIEGIGRFVLGRYSRSATDAQMSEYLKLFEQEIVETWADRFSDYSGQKFEVDGAAPAASGHNAESVAIVNSTFYTAPTAPVKIDWRVASRGDLFKITDVMVEGLSLARTMRDEYGSVIAKNGGDVNALIEELRRRNAS